MEGLKRVFETKKAEVWVIISYRILVLTSSQGIPALVTFVTAGYPRIEDTVPIMLAMEAGGADIIELGMPFSDPIADGPVIQETNTVSPSHPLGNDFLSESLS